MIVDDQLPLPLLLGPASACPLRPLQLWISRSHLFFGSSLPQANALQPSLGLLGTLVNGGLGDGGFVSE